MTTPGTAYAQEVGAARPAAPDPIRCEQLVRIYQIEKVEVQALQGLDLTIGQGELTAIVGASGSGKSTLLNVLSGLDVPSAGRASVAGHDLLEMGSRERLAYRRSVVGFTWQQTGRNLLPYLTALENVVTPMSFAGVERSARRKRAYDLLEVLGVSYCADRRSGQMSGVEQQRTAIAVALANGPQVLFADEPTGVLDSATSDDVFAAMRRANEELGVTVVVVTHDAEVSGRVRRTVRIRDGRIATETLRRTETDAHGVESHIAEEFAVLDRSGRLQLPVDYRDQLGLEDRVRLALEEDHVGVWPS